MGNAQLFALFHRMAELFPALRAGLPERILPRFAAEDGPAAETAQAQGDDVQLKPGIRPRPAGKQGFKAEAQGFRFHAGQGPAFQADADKARTLPRRHLFPNDVEDVLSYGHFVHGGHASPKRPPRKGMERNLAIRPK